MSVTSINYDEPNQDLYVSVDISLMRDKQKKTFNSGDFVKDWYDCTKYIITELSELNEPLMNSSSVDHFIMDGDKYESSYLLFDENGEPYLSKEYQNKGIELFVKSGTNPTWNELREICGDKRKIE